MRLSAIGEISRGLKLMAKDFGIPVVVLSQLNREVEHRTGGRPQLSDLRDSGAIEQDADMVAFIHRKMMPSANEEPDPSAELIVAKHRNGPTAIIQLHFQESSPCTESWSGRLPPRHDENLPSGRFSQGPPGGVIQDRRWKSPTPS